MMEFFLEDLLRTIIIFIMIMGIAVGMPMQVEYKTYCEEIINENTNYEIIINEKDTYTCTDYKENDKERTEEGEIFQNCRKDDIAIIIGEEYTVLSKSEVETMEIKPIVQDKKQAPSREGFFEYLKQDRKLS